MKRIVRYVSILVIGFLLYSCSNESKGDDLSSFDYIASLSFDAEAKTLIAALPDGVKLLGENEEAMSFEFTTDDIRHEITFLFYGDVLFHETWIHIDFSKKPELIDPVFVYLEKQFYKKHGKAYLSDTKNPEDAHHSWHVDPLETELNRHITLTKSGLEISVQLTQFGAFDGMVDDWEEWMEVE
jgi:hypothetical protein